MEMDVGLEKQTVELEKIMLLRGFAITVLFPESTREQVEQGWRRKKAALASSGGDGRVGG